MATVTNINDVLDGHVTLVVDCCDRLLLNAYVPKLQTSGQVASFMRDHLGKPIPSPAVMDQIGNRFRRDVKSYASRHKIPILHLKKPDRTRWDDRKLDHVRPYLERAERAGRYGVVAIVQVQEFQWVFSAKDRSATPGRPYFQFVREQRRVGVYYFYVLDPTFGPSFVKIVTFFPYPAKVWANGHEWAKRQAEREGITFRSLQNGFAACSNPERLQAICDRFGPDDLQELFDRWIVEIPRPLTDADREAGYFWELSMRQVEVSRTVVFDDPRRARRFFESLVQDNIDIGRPESVSMVFSRRVTKRTKEPFRERVFTAGSDVRLDFSYKHSRVKQYLKEGRAYRIETVVNKPADLGLRSRIANLPELVARARAVNERVLSIERAGQGCAIGSALFERIHQPYAREGQRTGALRFGDVRAMALAGALCCLVHAVTGITNKSLRGLVAGLLGTDYSTNQMSYDLRRLRLHGIIERVAGTNTYRLTTDGIRVAVFYTKVRARILGPLLEAHDAPSAPLELRRALMTIDRVVGDYVTNARMGIAA